jgi:hypothetical protein
MTNVDCDIKRHELLWCSMRGTSADIAFSRMAAVLSLVV